jgi:hypothetical protein
VVPAARTAERATTAEVAESVEGLDLGSLTPTIEVVESASDSGPGEVKSASVTCPAGTRLLAGGGGVTGDAAGVALVRSSVNGNGWIVTARALVPTDAAWAVDVAAVCGSLAT